MATAALPPANLPRDLRRDIPGWIGQIAEKVNALIRVQPLLLPRPNHIVNGDFDIWQRGTAINNLAVGGADGFTADRWYLESWGSPTGECSVQQTTDVPSSDDSNHLSARALYCLVDTAETGAPASTEAIAIVYRMEGYDYAQLKDKTVTLSFWVKSPATGTFCVGFRNSGNDRSNVAEYVINAANTYEKKEITLTFDQSGGTENYSAGAGLSIVFTLMAGSSFETATPNSWVSANKFSTSNQVNLFSSATNDIKFSQVKLEIGSSATQFVRNAGSIPDELIRCERYFQKSFRLTIQPATQRGQLRNGFSSLGASQTHTVFIPFRTRMRASAGTVTTYNPTNNNALPYDATAAADVTSITAGADETELSCTVVTQAGSALGNQIYFDWTVESELT